MPETKNVKIEVSYPTYGGAIKEQFTVPVPLGLTAYEEKKFIDQYVEDHWGFLYGR